MNGRGEMFRQPQPLGTSAGLSILREPGPVMYAPPPEVEQFQDKLDRFRDATALVRRASQRARVSVPDAAIGKVVEFVYKYGADEQMTADLLRLFAAPED